LRELSVQEERPAGAGGGEAGRSTGSAGSAVAAVAAVAADAADAAVEDFPVPGDASRDGLGLVFFPFIGWRTFRRVWA